MARRRPYRVRLAGDQRTHAYTTRRRAIDAAQDDCIHHPTYGGAPLAVALVTPGLENGVLIATVRQLRQRQEIGA